MSRRHAIIVGAGPGLGLGAARAFGVDGFTVSLLELKGSGIRARTLTVMGTVQSGSAFDPDAIGRAYLDLHRKPTEGFPVEVQYRGQP